MVANDRSMISIVELILVVEVTLICLVLRASLRLYSISLRTNEIIQQFKIVLLIELTFAIHEIFDDILCD